MLMKDFFPGERFLAMDKSWKEILGVLYIYPKTDIFNELKHFFGYISFYFWMLFILGPLKMKRFIDMFHEMSSYSNGYRKKSIAEIYLLAVKNRERNSGIGSLLLKESHLYIKNTLCRGTSGSVLLLAFESNPAVHLYKRMGYVTEEVIKTKHPNEIAGDKYRHLLIMILQV